MSRDHIRKERKVRHVCYSDMDSNAFVQTQVTYPENDQRQAIHHDTSSTRPAYTGGRREERRWDGDKKERRRREELMQIDKDPLTHYLYVSLQDTPTGL